jgi:ribosome-associated translation inhibitor RaiA
MNKIQKNYKIKKHIGLTEDDINLVNSYASLTKNDFSTSCRELILRGLENLEIADNLRDSINFSIAKLDRNQKDFDKKIMKILMMILKTSYSSKDFTAVLNRKNLNISDEDYQLQLNKIETNAIKRALKTLGENEDESL